MKEIYENSNGNIKKNKLELKIKESEVNEILQKNVLEGIKKLFSFEEKETTNFERITEQGQSNYTLYIVENGSKLKLIKDGKESIIELPVDSVIGESTFLQYFNGKKNYEC